MANKKSTCPICYEEKNLISLKITCNHEFCKLCLIKIIKAKYDGDSSTLPSCPLCRRDWIKTGNRAVNRELDAYCEEYELRKKYPFMGIKRTKLYFVFENFEEKRRKTIRYPKNRKFKTYQNY